MLRTFQVLPNQPQAMALTDGDILWCALNMILDDEEEAALLCPACRQEAGEGRCPACGGVAGSGGGGENAAFDWARFERLKGGE